MFAEGQQSQHHPRAGDYLMQTGKSAAKRAAKQAEQAATQARAETEQLKVQNARAKEKLGLKAARALRARTGGGFSYNPNALNQTTTTLG